MSPNEMLGRLVRLLPELSQDQHRLLLRTAQCLTGQGSAEREEALRNQIRPLSSDLLKVQGFEPRWCMSQYPGTPELFFEALRESSVYVTPDAKAFLESWAFRYIDAEGGTTKYFVAPELWVLQFQDNVTTGEFQTNWFLREWSEKNLPYGYRLALCDKRAVAALVDQELEPGEQFYLAAGLTSATCELSVYFGRRSEGELDCYLRTYSFNESHPPTRRFVFRLLTPSDTGTF